METRQSSSTRAYSVERITNPDSPVTSRPQLPGRFQRLAALPTAPGLARVFVVQAAREWGLSGSCIDSAELLTSELVTNAVKQTGRVEGSPLPKTTEHVAIVCVWVRMFGAAIRIEVWDDDSTYPTPVTQSPDMESGRGLFLVEALSKRWGAYSPKGGGKVVWCEVGITEETLRRLNETEIA